MNLGITKSLFFFNTVLLILFSLIFLFFPDLDILLSKYFFYEGKFISEKYTFIKTLRKYLKEFMVFIPILSLFFLISYSINRRQKIKQIFRLRTKYALIGLILGPIIGCGIIANLYFKDTWGRARPVHIEEFGGDKIFTPPFLKSDQCYKNCSWISGETSAAFSFVVGTLLFKKKFFLICNLILGILVFFCRLSMGGHFFSDNIFAMIFMIYLAILYKNLVYSSLKKRLLNERSFSNY